MMPARIKAGFDERKSAPLIHVPNGLFESQIAYLPTSKTIPYSLAFAGTIGPENGLDLAIQALEKARKKIPELSLNIFGSGLPEEEKKIADLIKKLGLEKSVTNHGFISDLNVLSKKLMKYQIGLAPYRAISWSVRWYADATKIRLYFANGLPVITTQVPPLGKEVEQKHAAIVVNDTISDFSNAIVSMATNKNAYEKYRNAAIHYAKNNTWENSYNNAVKKMNLT
jgi:glycosyltransferase involved in cell wall biosynthesis